MPSKSHTEFEYRTQINGETIWEKIKILRGFYEGRIRAAKLEEVNLKKYQAQIAKLEYLKRMESPEHVVLELKAEILEVESAQDEAKILYSLNKEEIQIIEKILADYYAIAEPTRIEDYSDEQMYEANAANEFTAVVAKHIHASLIACGQPNPVHIEQAMSNPVTWNACIKAGLIPEGNQLLQLSNNPDNVFISLPLKVA